MKTTHVCLKTFFVRDRLGTMRPTTTRAFIAPGLKHNLLLSGKALIKGYRVILDSDNEEGSGSGSIRCSERKIEKAKSFAFISELSSLFYLQIETMSATVFAQMSGWDSWELWHRRLAHSSIRNIQESIPYTSRMEELFKRKYENHLKCPAFMIGKATLADFPQVKS
jgi:hypothetical protein